MLPLNPAATSEEALERYQQGHRTSSIALIVSVIDFRKEAAVVLRREKRSSVEPSAAEIAETAQVRKRELRDLYARHGFNRGLNVGSCHVVTKFENSPVQHSFVLRDESHKNSVNVFTLAFHKSEGGWFLVRSA